MATFKTAVITVLLTTILAAATANNGGSRGSKFTDNLEQFMIDQKLKSINVAVVQDRQRVYVEELKQNNIESESKTESEEIDPLDEPKHEAESNNFELHHAHGHIPAMDVNHIITCLSVLTLKRDGLLDLDRKVFADDGILEGMYDGSHGDDRTDSIRVVHLLQQTIGWGVRDMKWSEMVAGTGKDWSFRPINEVLDRVLARRMMWDSGAAYNFSVVNDYLLRSIVSKLSGQDYKTYTGEKVLQPLQLRHTKLVETGSKPLRDYTMPLLSSLWITSIHDLAKIIMATDGDRDLLNVDLSILYSRPEEPYPQTTGHWHSPSYIMDKHGAFWGESVSSNGHYLFIYHSGTELTRAEGSLDGQPENEHENVLVLYAKGHTHRHFKPILVKMMEETWINE